MLMEMRQFSRRRQFSKSRCSCWHTGAATLVAVDAEVARQASVPR